MAQADPFLDALSSVRGGQPSGSAQPAAESDPFLDALTDVRQPTLAQQAVRMGVRVVPSILGSIGGGILGAAGGPPGVIAGIMGGGALGAGLGEAGAEFLESRPGQGQVREGLNPTQIATQTALGAIPITKGRVPLSVAQMLLRQGAKGAALGGTSSAATSLAEGESPSLPHVAGAAMLGTALGAGASALGRARPPAAPPPTRGFLRAGPGFVAGESGPAARFGEAIPMQRAPDGSFTRSVRAPVGSIDASGAPVFSGEVQPPTASELSQRGFSAEQIADIRAGRPPRRPVRGLLPPGPRFIAGESGSGPAATLEQATALQAARSGGADAFTAALNEIRGSAPLAESKGRLVSAAPLAYEFEGRKLRPTQFSSDVNAQPAPKVDLTPDLNRELRRMAAEMENLPYTARTWNWLDGPKTGNAAGGAADIVAGSAGARVYNDIVGDVSGSGRNDVLKAIQNLLQGKRTPTGDLALDVARRRLAGELKGEFPPAAGDFYRLPGEDASQPSGPRVPRFQQLQPDQMAVQEQVASALERDPERFVQAYRQRFDNVVGADNFKELFPQYASSSATRTRHDLSVHRAASVGAQAVYEQMLREPTPAGRDPFVVLTAGGTGSGKTSGLTAVFPHLRDAAKIVYDSTLSNVDAAVKNIEAARQTGHQVAVVFSDTDLLDAFRWTLTRAAKEGRPITINTHLKTHVRSHQALPQLIAEYADTPDVDFFVIRNTPGGRDLVPVAEWQPRQYNESSARSQLAQILDAEHQAGRVSDDVWQAVRAQTPHLSQGGTPDPGRVGSSGPAGVSPPSSLNSESGFISPTLALRAGGSAIGAVTGALAPGDDATLEDRILGAVAGAGVGYGGARLLTRGGGPSGGFLRSGPAVSPTAGRLFTTAPASRQPVPPAGQIPTNRLHTMPTLTEDVQDAADAILEQHGGFVRQRRGVQSVARTEGLADRVDVRTDRPLTPGTAANAERLRAYQNATATLLQKRQQTEQAVRELDAAVTQGRATDAQRLALPTRQLELERLKTESDVLTKSLRGLTSEAGRALHILRYQARILASGDQQAIAEAAQASRQGLNETAQSYFYANILSGVQTHERNVLGNLSNAVYNLAAHPFAVAADVVRAKVTGQARQVFLGELPERVAGTVAALPRAFSNALRSLRTGVPAAEVTSFDRPAIREFAGGGANPFNYPKRALESVDDFFSTVAAEQTLYGAAFAQAKREGLSGPALVRRVADLKVNPSDDILREVESNRARLLFREKPGAIADAVLAAKRRLPALGYVAPFVKIPANIIRQGFEASPAGFVMKGSRQGGRAGADAMGRAAMGSLALAPLAYYAALGKITGDAPRDPAQRAAFYESGKRPHSIQFGDTWYSYQPIQPLNVPLSLVANAYQVWNETKGDPDTTADEIALSVLGRMGSSLLDQSFLSGVSALVDALGDPERYFQRFAQQLATGFVPFSSAMRMTAQATDPYIRAPQGIAEGVQAILPGASQSLPPRLTRFGEPVERVEGALNVFKPSPVVTDPVAAALEAADVNLRPAQGPKNLAVQRGLRLPLDRAQQFNVGQASGRTIRQVLDQLIATPQFQQAPPVIQQQLIERAIAEARGAVNEQAVRERLFQALQQ